MSQGIRILIVEDELVIASDLQQSLNELGYDAFAIASSADEAIAICSKDAPAMVLMDIRIKGERDGIETARMLRDRFGTPVIFLTAHADQATLNRGAAALPYGYLIKPVRMAELRSTIEIGLHRHGIEVAERRARELEAEKDALLHLAKLKSDFLMNISHELRTPLHGALGFAELIQMGAGAGPKQQAEFLDQVIVSGRHLVRLIDAILDLADLEAGEIGLKYESIDLPQLVQQVIAIVQDPAVTQSPIEVEIEPGLSHIMSDRRCLRQIIYAYLSNAVKFAPKGSAIRFTASREQGERLRISVQDRGTAISLEDIGRLFIPFHQLKSGLSRPFEGAGIGLALARRMAENLQGEVGHESTATGGNCFYAILPLRTQQP